MSFKRRKEAPPVGPPAAGAALTVRDIAALYLRHSAVEGVHGAVARADRERTLGWFVKDLGEMNVAELRPYHLTDWVEQHTRWVSASTRRAKSNAVRACFQWAADQERIGRNPFRQVRYAEAERRPELPDPEHDRIATLANKPFEQAVRFLRLTGCRLSEMNRATWGDVDLERGLWLIPKHKSRRHTGRPKIVALVTEAMELLRSIRAGRPDATADSPVFLNTRGKPWTSCALGECLRRMKRRHRIGTKATLHGLRHNFATQAIANGAPIKLVAEQLGHASVMITESYYFHRTDAVLEGMRDAAQKGVPKKAPG